MIAPHKCFLITYLLIVKFVEQIVNLQEKKTFSLCLGGSVEPSPLLLRPLRPIISASDDECEQSMECLARTIVVLVKHMLQCPFVHHKSHMT
jgi:hypothetical protein